ncbi:hypothetical protein [Butyrivibrio sp. YAB3001]|uniref:hypothetical protein n=1 Tax=Butyrivibrio sp. YAB3001 TaxID=1520812 RepID=UPI0008F653B7|nr:hypothetical protein [Butyrivibrio sp. YAB3001]SFD11248.1 hypothetical protein SAMN02910398_04094 [Butyrivibrio sp. YAB3001]
MHKILKNSKVSKELTVVPKSLGTGLQLCLLILSLISLCVTVLEIMDLTDLDANE